MSAIIFESERLYCIPWNSKDVNEWFALSSDPGINDFIFSSYEMSCIEESKRFIEKWSQFYTAHKCGVFPVREKFSKKIIGIVAIKFLKADDEEEDQPEIMYRIAKEYQGKGYATEIMKEYLNYALNTLEFKRVIAFVDYDNVKSIIVLKKLGFSYLRKSSYMNHPYDLYEIKK